MVCWLLVLRNYILTPFSLVYSAAVAQLKIQNSLLAADNHVSFQAVENIKMMLNMLKYIVTIISNFMKLEPTILRIPHFLNSTKCASSKNHLATVTPSTSESGIFDTLQRWQQRAIVLVMGAGGVNSLVGKAAILVVNWYCCYSFSILFYKLLFEHSIRYNVN